MLRVWMTLTFDQCKYLNVPLATGMFPKSSISQCDFKQLQKNEAYCQKWKTEWYPLIGICSFPSSVSGSPSSPLCPPPRRSSYRFPLSVSWQERHGSPDGEKRCPSLFFVLCCDPIHALTCCCR